MICEEVVEDNDQVEQNIHTVGGLNNTLPTATATTAASITSAPNGSIFTAPKEKRRWFSSLTRRKKSQSQISLVNAIYTNSNEQTLHTIPTPQNNNNNSNSNSNNNNNNHVSSNESSSIDEIAATGTSRKRKDEKNMFQRFRKKIGIRFSALRRGQFEDTDEQMDTNGTTDASAEFLTHSPARKPHLAFRFMDGNNKLTTGTATGAGTGTTTTTPHTVIEETEMVPFTHDYKRFIVKKWLENDSRPNRIMYKASCEMLSQVWYWGEISRRDAQKQLTDKPTGSFLVRDSETSGCQFTLSFRIVNVTLHYRLEYRDHYWHFEELQYESIVEMIEDILYRCTNDNFVCFVKVPNEIQPPFPVILKYPLSRYLKMPHLQDLCRRVIQRHAAQDAISKLPIPPKLLEYLSDPRELVFQS